MAQFGGKATLQHIPVHLSIDEMTDEIAVALTAIDGDIDGVVAASDAIATAAIRQLAALGISVPDDIAVIGFDDLPLARHSLPQLTTIRQDITGGARRMVELLREKLDGGTPASTVMAPELIVRDSA